jgi:vacuolar-type H+-ATPase subunit E/Vma4
MTEIPDAQRFAQMIATLTLDLNSWLDKIADEAEAMLRQGARQNGIASSKEEAQMWRNAARAGAALALGRVHRILGEEAIAMISKAVNDD